MRIISVKDIIIKFNDDNEELAKHVEVVISNNYNMFCSVLNDNKNLSLVPTNECLYVEDFDEFFKEIVVRKLSNKEMIEMFEDDELLINLYYSYLIKNNLGDFNSFFGLDDELFYFVVGCKYYNENGTFDDFVNFLMDRNDLDKLTKWLKCKARFPLYNHFLLDLVTFFKNNDKDLLFFKNIKNMNLFESNFDNKNKKRDHKLFDISDIDNMFYEFLDSVKAPCSWKDIYKKFRLSGMINFNSDKSRYVGTKDGESRINISADKDIGLVFSSLVHEFIHCMVDLSVTNKKDSLSSFSEYLFLSEIPSVFFERRVINFLKNKGYCINDIISIRIFDNYRIMKKLTSLFIDMDMFYENGFISFKQKADGYLWIEDDKSEIFNLAEEIGIGDNKLLQSILSLDVNVIVDRECDKFINKFIEDGLFIVDGYQYLVATFMNDMIDAKYGSDNMDVSKMVYVINNIDNMDLEKILDIFDIRDVFLDISRKNKVVSRVKKIN